VAGSSALAAIPYHTFPTLVKVGSFEVRTFGLMVGLGVLIGALLAARYAESFGVDREQTYSLATRLVVAGVIGARITWDISHWDQIHSPLDLIAVWNGGLQFSGGFVAAVLVGLPTFRAWPRLTRWRMLDGYALGLTIGLAFGRVGCTSVGEHFGSTWGAGWFPFMVRFDGGTVREPELGGRRLVEGTVFHNVSIYELVILLVLFGVLWRLLHRRRPAVVTPGTGIGLFCALYGAARFGTDFLRVNDETVLGLTGAQYLMLAVLAAAAWILLRVRPKNADLLAAEGDEGDEAAGAGGDGDEAEAPGAPEPAADA